MFSEDSDLDGNANDCDICDFDADDDIDGDEICSDVDNCPLVSNEDQIDTDGDTEGDACDTDDDNDGCLDTEDDNPLVFSEDSDLDGNANDCDICDFDADDDIDQDGVCGDIDNCVDIPNLNQDDYDFDMIGNECDDCYQAYGDVNADDILDITDLIMMIPVILDIDPCYDPYTDNCSLSECSLEKADADQSSTVDIIDVIWVVNEILYDDIAARSVQNVNLFQSSDGLRIESNGVVALQFEILHNDDFELKFNDNIYLNGSKTFDNSMTRVVAVYPKDGMIFTTQNDFEIVNIIAASGDSYIDVNFDIVPEQFEISSVYPNPFNPVASIDYVIPQESHLNVRVFDIRGNEVDVLINEVKMAGNYSIKWDATQFASGVYFMRFDMSGETKVRKMVLMK